MMEEKQIEAKIDKNDMKIDQMKEAIIRLRNENWNLATKLASLREENEKK